MSDELEIFSRPQRCKVEPPPPPAVKAWAQFTHQHADVETQNQAEIRDLQRRVHRLEQLVRAYGLHALDAAAVPPPFSASAEALTPTTPPPADAGGAQPKDTCEG